MCGSERRPLLWTTSAPSRRRTGEDGLEYLKLLSMAVGRVHTVPWQLRLLGANSTPQAKASGNAQRSARNGQL